jgi:hypothetical protein
MEALIDEEKRLEERREEYNGVFGERPSDEIANDLFRMEYLIDEENKDRRMKELQEKLAANAERERAEAERERAEAGRERAKAGRERAKAEMQERAERAEAERVARIEKKIRDKKRRRIGSARNRKK